MNDEEPMEQNTILNEFVHKYNEIRDELSQLEDKKKTIHTIIKTMLKESELTYYKDLDGNVVTYKPQTRITLDKKKVEELLGEVTFKEVIKPSEFNTLRVTTPSMREKIPKKNA